MKRLIRVLRRRELGPWPRFGSGLELPVLLVTAGCFFGCGGSGNGARSSIPETAPTTEQPEDRPAPPLVLGPAPHHNGAAPAPIVHAMSQELTRAMNALKAREHAPYFISYQVIDSHTMTIRASHGALIRSKASARRTLGVSVRVGSHELDNTHRLPGTELTSTFRGHHILPLTEIGPAFRNALWLGTVAEYDRAKEAWLRVLASRNDDSKKQPSLDYSYEAQVHHYEPIKLPPTNPAAWERRVVALSELGKKYPALRRSGVSLQVTTETRYFVSSSGTSVQTSEQRAHLISDAVTVAEDGMVLERSDTVSAHYLATLPSQTELTRRFSQVLADVSALRSAPVIEPYAGPAVLDGQAAGVFFHEVFGHRVEGHRQTAENEGQTFSSRLGQQVMNPALSVYDDPRIYTLNGVELNGSYSHDDEGVVAQRASLVENGILTGFLMSRSPIQSQTRSNGHGRRQAAHGVVARQANLIVEPSRVVTQAALKQALLREVARQGLPYGLRIGAISGGFTQTQRFDTQAFKVMPMMVYRVYPDGREQLVRGVDLEGTPLAALSQIALAGDDYAVFNGTCGAESGWVPVSATSPSLLLSQIEVTRRPVSDARPPLLPAPSLAPQQGDN